MTVAAPASEILDVPTVGRVFTATRPVRLGDVDTRARLRLDATARYLQDVATDDTADAGLDDERESSWVVRRTMIEIHQAAALDERIELRTFCSGTGRSWAERRTSITGSAGARIEAVSLWIRIDVTTGRPTALGDRFHDLYGPAAAGRRVSSRLRLPVPPEAATTRPWPIRRVDLDPLDHVNNAVHWSIVEETLPHRARRGCAEIEYLLPIEPEMEVTVVTDATTGPLDVDRRSSWLVADSTTLTAARWTPAP